MGKADQCIAALENLLSSPLPRYMRLLAPLHPGGCLGS